MRRTKFANWLITFFVAIVLVLLGGFFAFTLKGVSLLGITEEQLAAYKAELADKDAALADKDATIASQHAELIALKKQYGLL